MNVGEKKQLML